MEFDKLVHQPTRLQIFAHLYRHGETSFGDLQEALGVTEGNLSSHLTTMEEADVLAVEKQFVDRRPRTSYRLTDDGRAAFEEHVRTLEALVEDID